MKRVLTALALIPPVVWAVLWAPYEVVLGAVAIVACLCYREYSNLTDHLCPGSGSVIGYGLGLALLVWPGDTGLLLTLFVLAGLILAMRAPDLTDALPRTAYPITGVLYIFGCWKCALLVWRENPHWLLFALIVNWAGDVGAYYAGRNFGRHKLAPRVSPAKTWEGAAGGMLAALLIAGSYVLHFVPGVSVAVALLTTLAANAAGQVGDLAESALKRGAKVKDSGTLLPGHGGMLDRVDSALFALPVVYVCLRAAGMWLR